MFSINNIDWQVQYVSPISDYLKRTDGTYSVGACDDVTKTIYLSEIIDGHFLKKVLCHEITHAAMFSYGVHLSLDNEELIADLIATYGEEIIKTTDRIFKRLKRGY